MRVRGTGRTVAGMLPALRLSFLTLAVLLISSPAAQAAKTLSVPIPAEGQVAVAVGSGAKGVKVKSAPAGVTVAGGVKKGRLAVAVVRPRGVAASGKVVFTLRGKAKGVKTFGAALDGGKAGAACKDLGALLSKRLKGTADMKALSPVVTAKLCGKAAPADSAAVLQRLGLGVAPIQQGSLAPPPPSTSRPAGGGTARPAPTPTPTATPAPGGRPVRQRQGRRRRRPDRLGGPGLLGRRRQERGQRGPGVRRLRGGGRDPDGRGPDRVRRRRQRRLRAVLVGRDRPRAGRRCRARRTTASSAPCSTRSPTRRSTSRTPRPTMVDVGLVLKAPVDCDKKYTIAFWRRNGPIAELHEKVRNCRTLPAPPPKCSNGKDDDGDGMIDSRDWPPAPPIPIPGCSSTADTSENSELPIPRLVRRPDRHLRSGHPAAGPLGRGLRRAQGRLVQAARHAGRLRVQGRRQRRGGVRRQGRHRRSDVPAHEHAGAAGDAARRRRDVLAGDGRAGARERRGATPTASPFC